MFGSFRTEQVPPADLYAMRVVRVQPVVSLLLAGAAVAQAEPANQLPLPHVPLVVDAH